MTDTVQAQVMQAQGDGARGGQTSTNDVSSACHGSGSLADETWVVRPPQMQMQLQQTAHSELTVPMWDGRLGHTNKEELWAVGSSDETVL